MFQAIFICFITPPERLCFSDRAVLILKIIYEILSGYIRKHPTLEFNRAETRDESVGWEPCGKIDSLFGDSNEAVSIRCG